jgi:hypothetical protein
MILKLHPQPGARNRFEYWESGSPKRFRAVLPVSFNSLKYKCTAPPDDSVAIESSMPPAYQDRDVEEIRAGLVGLVGGLNRSLIPLR